MKYSLHRLTCIFAATGLAFAAFTPHYALAKKMHKKSSGRRVSAIADVDSTGDQVSADVLENQLDQAQKKSLKKSARKGPNRAAHALGLAYTALLNHNYGQAISLAKTAQNDELFADYANWIQGLALEEEAKNAITAKQMKTAGLFAQQAYARFSAILNGDPYSGLVHESPKQLGVSEMFWAQAISPSRAALKHYLTAFQRLNQQKALYEIKPDFVDSFAKNCSKFKSPVCDAWVVKLSPGDEKPKPPSLPPRSTQVYKAPDLDTVAFDSLMLSVHDSKWSDAITKLKSFLDDYPRSQYRYRARYQLALADLQKNQKDDAKKEFDSLAKDSPLTFYGLASALAQGKTIDSAIDNSFPITARHDALLNPEEVYRLNRAEILLTENAGDLAALELRGIGIRPQQSSPFLMYLAVLNRRAGAYPMVFQILSELIQRSYPGVASQFGLKMVFPIADFDVIKRYSKVNGVDPILVMSLIKQESAFDVRASSGSGASGLMQLMPFTAVETVPGITREQLVEAEANVNAGSKYLAKLLEHYKGNIVLALGAYNAGPGAMDRWVHEGIQEKRNMIQFIEAIPFKETQNYVASIIRNYYWYSKFVKKAQPVGLEYFWKPYKDLNKEVGMPQVNPGAAPVLASDSGAQSGDDDLEKIVNDLPPVGASGSPTPVPSSGITQAVMMGPSSAPSATPSAPSAAPSSTPVASPSSSPFYGPLPEASALPNAAASGIPSVVPAPSPSVGVTAAPSASPSPGVFGPSKI